jgi:carbonic anhydrase
MRQPESVPVDRGDVFDDVLRSNEDYQAHFCDSGMRGVAARGLAVLTCIDSRIEPLAMLGLRPGDAKIIRNAGARVTDDALRSLILATNLLGATRVCLVQHTDCALAGASEDEVRQRVTRSRGVDASGWHFHAMVDQIAAVHADIERMMSCPLLHPDVEVGGFIFDVHTGALAPV